MSAILGMALAVSSSAAAQTPTTKPQGDPGRVPYAICIDPGHGGANVGAEGPSSLLEKDLALKIARRLKFLLEERLGARVVLTRDGDTDITLDERVSIANHNNADIFVSIHLNASRSGHAAGSETYFLNHQASDSEARAAATEENGVLPEEAVKGGDGSPDLQVLLWELAQQEYLQESSRLAEAIQSELNGIYDIQDRGIKQAPFRVLMGARMPAVLVEVGFISNKDEEKKLASDAFQATIAGALYRAISAFLADFPRKAVPAAGGTQG